MKPGSGEDISGPGFFVFHMANDDTIDMLYQARLCARIARDHLTGVQVYSREQVLAELEDAGTILTYLILNHKNRRGDGQPQS